MKPALVVDLERRIARLESILIKSTASPAAIGPIIDAAVELFGLTRYEIVGDGRRFAAVRARFAVCWVAQKATCANASAIGRALGDRDHGTILNAVSRAEELREKDASFRRVSDQLLATTRERAV